MNHRPVIFYVDDEPFQHIAMEQILPDDWELHCFESPVEALTQLATLNPSLIISDQRMPQMQGFKFLETARQICPEAIRIITTGYNDENSIIESIRSAKIFDYIIKPWDLDKLLQSLERAADFYNSERSRKILTADLDSKNQRLSVTLKDLEILVSKYQEVQNELKSWVHPFVLEATEEKLKFPLKKDLALLVIDIIDSSRLHTLTTDAAQDIRTKVLQAAWESVLKHGGEIESQEGDKVYANFGLSKNSDNVCNAAFAAAKEFRASLQALTDHYGVNVQTGIAVHFSKGCKVNLRQGAINTADGIVVRKKFDTSSIDVDLCHRMESLTHRLPGSNILLSEEIKSEITANLDQIVFVGEFVLKGQTRASKLYLLKSDRVSVEDLNQFKSYLNQLYPNTKAS